MNNELVSVIMPSYNCGRFIEESISSVQNQTYQNWELIIVDDGSNDDTIKRVQKVQLSDSRIRLFRNKINSGAAVSRNNALLEAKGKWVAFLDSDDLWEPTKLEKQIGFMEKNGYAFTYTGYKEIDEKSRATGVVLSGPEHITKAGMFAFCWPGCLTVMYDREKIVLLQISDIKKNNDYAMWLKVIKHADCYLLDECLAMYRRGRKGSISSHSYITLIKWHYKLFRDAERMNPVSSTFLTMLNLVCGVYKKVRYVKRS